MSERLGDSEGARASYQRAISLYSDSLWAEKAKERLATLGTNGIPMPVIAAGMPKVAKVGISPTAGSAANAGLASKPTTAPVAPQPPAPVHVPAPR